MLSSDLQQKINLKAGRSLSLLAGNRKVRVCFGGIYGNAPGPALYAAENLRQQLLLPSPLQLNLCLEADKQTLRLGPLIGILANRYAKVTKPFGEQTSFFRKLRHAADGLNGLCFAFSPDDIDWKNGNIRGSLPPLPGDETTGWKTHTLPFPDVIYDRGLFPQGEKRKRASATRKLLRRHPGLKMFNPAFFGKWKTHQLLAKHETLYQHLPETKLYTSPDDLFRLLRAHGTVYLKPCGGSSGRGIIRVTVSGQGFIIDYRVHGQVKTLNVTKPEELINLLQPMISGRRFIVQQGLKLAKIKGCPFDIRILMQRNRHGQWLRTGMAVRAANQGSYISNLHAGGHAGKVSLVLPRVFPDFSLVGKAVNDIRRICALIASWVTAEAHPLFGEIAVDLGIDESCKVWIIELNAVPGRSIFRRIKSTQISSQAISRPMEYALFISGFSPHSSK